MVIGALRNQPVQHKSDEEPAACSNPSCAQSEDDPLLAEQAAPLLGTLNDRQNWTDCDEEPATCIEQLPARAKLVNYSPAPTLCGQVGFAQQGPLPWAVSGGTEIMPSRACVRGRGRGGRTDTVRREVRRGRSYRHAGRAQPRRSCGMVSGDKGDAAASRHRVPLGEEVVKR